MRVTKGEDGRRRAKEVLGRRRRERGGKRNGRRVARVLNLIKKHIDKSLYYVYNIVENRFWHI